MKGKRTQIFIDLHTKGQAAYRGIEEEFAPTLMVQVPGDGNVDVLEYEGSGDDWKWVSAPAHITLSHPSPGTDRVEFDETLLAHSKHLSVVFRSLNDAWAPVASSKPLPWHPS
ncbi:MAG: hypothetical protein PW735_10245 [Acidobacteriaceae bacterium]|nr:hypothetical protein [Acidobacteriaceae bacterium]